MKILCIYGTRPEAIKMAPLVNILKKSSFFKTAVLTTGQHLELVESINKIFEVPVDFPENIFEPGQSINSILSKSIESISGVITKYGPDLVIVQGDTTTAMAGAISAFMNGTKVAHVEAGLRTNNISLPFPEEFNRRVISLCTSLHFASTNFAKENLVSEGISKENIFITGNTVIDSAKYIIQNSGNYIPRLDMQKFYKKKADFLLLTLHRRESWGTPIENISNSIAQLAGQFPDINVLFPIHPNPKIANVVGKILNKIPNVNIVPALDYVDMIHAISRCKFVLTDSGGIQEEAPFFNKPVLVLRNETERMEGVLNGCSRLVGTDGNLILKAATELLQNVKLMEKMSTALNPYGDGISAARIVSFLEWHFEFSNIRPLEFQSAT